MAAQHSTTVPSMRDHFMAVAQACAYAIETMEAELRAAHHDPIWDMKNRNGIERRIKATRGGVDLICLDIDNMKEQNALHGEEGFDALMREVVKLRKEDFIDWGRWDRGDWIVGIVPTGEGKKAAQRLLRDMLAHGFSATIAVVSDVSQYEASISQARVVIEAAKAAHVRGIIMEV